MAKIVVLVYTVNVYIPASLGRWPILRYQVLQVRKNCTHFTRSVMTDSYFVVGIIVNNFKLILPDTFCQQYLLLDTIYRKHKTQPYVQSETLFLSMIFRELF